MVTIIEELRRYAEASGTELIIVGSIAHRYDGGKRSGAGTPNDVDCIFVYSDMDKLENNPLVSAKLLRYIRENKKAKNIDLFSVKREVRGMEIAADFITLEYIQQLALEPYDGTSYFRRKFNDSAEVPTNTYYNLSGGKHVYIKPHEKEPEGNIYTLPTKLFVDSVFYPGVLLNKFIHAPILDYVHSKEIKLYCEKIAGEFFSYVNKECKNNPFYEARNILEPYYASFCDRAKVKINNAMDVRMNILVTGSSGFIGRNLVQALRQKHFVAGVDKAPAPFNIDAVFYQTDILDEQMIESIMTQHQIDTVIHSAAEKSLLNCEKDPDFAHLINYTATLKLFDIARKHGAKFILISSDQVFDGKKGMYKEKDSAKFPINYYGKCKDWAEQIIMEHENTAVCRTAMVFGHLNEQDINLFKAIKDDEYLKVQSYIVAYVKQALSENRTVKMPEDEYISPTYMGLLLRQLMQVVAVNASGVLHCVGAERISRYEFAKRIAELYGLDSRLVVPIKHSDPLRPLDVSLDVAETEHMLGMKFPSVDIMLEEMRHDDV